MRGAPRSAAEANAFLMAFTFSCDAAAAPPPAQRSNTAAVLIGITHAMGRHIINEDRTASCHCSPNIGAATGSMNTLITNTQRRTAVDQHIR